MPYHCPFGPLVVVWTLACSSAMTTSQTEPLTDAVDIPHKENLAPEGPQ